MATDAAALMTAEEFAAVTTPESENGELADGEVMPVSSGRRVTTPFETRSPADSTCT
ncbi:MAG: hypothetical protein U0Q16_38390 [Bryobacteraceae bacterium]